MVETTLAIVKPDGVAHGVVGKVISRIEKAGLEIVAMKMILLSREQAAGFYAVHRGRPFYDELVEFMSSGPVVLLLLRGEGAIARWRELMGATDPAKAEPGTIRRDLALSLGQNTVHGSDAPETAAFETAYAFSALEHVR
ncbi:MAG: nucleoside-diphosphate kinase [Deltaproteobacteria bacterium]|nr:nucleoside-diphosphate kinase [Deltaproteobacteria bacterium]